MDEISKIWFSQCVGYGMRLHGAAAEKTVATLDGKQAILFGRREYQLQMPHTETHVASRMVKYAAQTVFNEAESRASIDLGKRNIVTPCSNSGKPTSGIQIRSDDAAQGIGVRLHKRFKL
ncbi:hypothetical protein EDD15DRAFT_2196931 [Pisolithus albus]|nr:hypothetical protein EDD15DRAFT_2196931 [Pisolithus albus]